MRPIRLEDISKIFEVTISMLCIIRAYQTERIFISFCYLRLLRRHRARKGNEIILLMLNSINSKRLVPLYLPTWSLSMSLLMNFIGSRCEWNWSTTVKGFLRRCSENEREIRLEGWLAILEDWFFVCDKGRLIEERFASWMSVGNLLHS